AIGLALTLIHLISIPVTNTSVNPARSTGPALIVALNGGSWAITELWMFWVAPIAGAIFAGFLYPWLTDDTVSPAASASAAVIDDLDDGEAVDGGNGSD